jgi:8-oxo-dGTP diphosphatase
MILVAAAVIKKDKQVLISRRAEGKHLAGYWEFPGGKIEPGETPEACLKREVFEELSIHIEINSFLAENLHEYSEKRILLKGYLCTYISGDMRLVDHDRAEWVNIDELSNFKIAPADIPFITILTQLS